MRRHAPLIAALLSAAAAAPGAVLRVDATLNTGANNGATWADAFQGRLGLQTALAAAQPGDEIWIADGQYAPAPANGSRAANFFLPPNITILGGFAGGESSADQRNPALHAAVLTGDLNSNDGPPVNGISPNISDNSHHVVRINNGDGLTLDGLTIRAGAANQSGGVQLERTGANLFILGGSPVIRDCIIENGLSEHLGAGAVAIVASPTFIDCTFRANRGNPGGSGAAVLDAAIATFENCTFEANYCGVGGGLYVGRLALINPSGPVGEAVVSGCRFVGNIGIISSPSGAAIMSRGGRLTVSNTLFHDNEVGGGGGACYLNGGAALFDRCDFYNNSAPGDGGGAVYIDGGLNSDLVFESTPVFTNCRFVGNNGALLSNFNGDVEVVNCTIANNSFGFGFLTWPPFLATGTSAISIKNTVIWGNNLAGVFGAEPLSGSGAYTVSRVLLQGWVPADGGDAINADPLFRDPDGPDNTIGTADDDVRPRYGSPAIDTGIDAFVPAASTHDLDGRARSIDADAQGGAVVDLGAYEHPCAPDIIADGVVNFADLNALLSLFGQSAGGPEDINADGFVGFADLNILLSAFGAGC